MKFNGISKMGWREKNKLVSLKKKEEFKKSNQKIKLCDPQNEE